MAYMPMLVDIYVYTYENSIYSNREIRGHLNERMTAQKIIQGYEWHEKVSTMMVNLFGRKENSTKL